MDRIEKAIEAAIKYRKHGVLITETFDLARKQAQNAAERGLTPFPIVVKDCFTMKDVPTTCASKMLANFIPDYSATTVSRLIERGGAVIGKGNLDEFSMGTSSALGYFGPVKGGSTLDVENDWLIPGGSSGGPAVAVALGIADIGLGSDTGGSTRNPAAFNGLFGLKPTYGVLSRYGLIPLVNSLDCPSIFARSGKDCKSQLEGISGVDAFDSTSIDLPTSSCTTLSNLKIGIPKEYHNEFLTEDAWKVWNKAANVATKCGATLVPISLPLTKYSLDCYQVLAAADIASNMARYDGVAYGHRSKQNISTMDLYSCSRSESLNSTVRRRIMAGNYFLMKKHRASYFDHALRVRRLIADELNSALQDLDAILTPSAAGPPPYFSETQKKNFTREDHDDFFTQSANMAGVPAISIPFGESSNGLPIGVQLMTRRLNDLALCDMAQLLFDAK